MTLEADIELIKKQELALQFGAFREEDAWRLGVHMHDMAKKRNLPIVIDIRSANKPLFYVALPGTTAENPDWVKRKINTVLRFERSSYRIGLEYKVRGLGFDGSRGIDPMLYANAGGGFPIHVTGVGVVGAVTVSGLPQRDDHAFVVEALATFLGVDLAGLALPVEEG